VHLNLKVTLNGLWCIYTYPSLKCMYEKENHSKTCCETNLINECMINWNRMYFSNANARIFYHKVLLIIYLEIAYFNHSRYIYFIVDEMHYLK
jgi:hypothetical protein